MTGVQKLQPIFTVLKSIKAGESKAFNGVKDANMNNKLIKNFETAIDTFTKTIDDLTAKSKTSKLDKKARTELYDAITKRKDALQGLPDLKKNRDTKIGEVFFKSTKRNDVVTINVDEDSLVERVYKRGTYNVKGKKPVLLTSTTINTKDGITTTRIVDHSVAGKIKITTKDKAGNVIKTKEIKTTSKEYLESKKAAQEAENELKKIQQKEAKAKTVFKQKIDEYNNLKKEVKTLEESLEKAKKDGLAEKEIGKIEKQLTALTTKKQKKYDEIMAETRAKANQKTAAKAETAAEAPKTETKTETNAEPKADDTKADTAKEAKDEKKTNWTPWLAGGGGLLAGVVGAKMFSGKPKQEQA